MAVYKAIVVGAGRIGAGFQWHDDEYTHAGAIHALHDRVELEAFVEPNEERAIAAKSKWGVSVYPNLSECLSELAPDIVSICTQPGQQQSVFDGIKTKTKAYWCEKPYFGPLPFPIPVQVNYLRRADPSHQEIYKKHCPFLTIVVTGKYDLHTWCHFEDLARWWKAKKLIHNIIEGPCSYTVDLGSYAKYFEIGGIDPAACMKGMLENLLDHIDNGTPILSPPY